MTFRASWPALLGPHIRTARNRFPPDLDWPWNPVATWSGRPSDLCFFMRTLLARFVSSSQLVSIGNHFTCKRHREHFVHNKKWSCPFFCWHFSYCSPPSVHHLPATTMANFAWAPVFLQLAPDAHQCGAQTVEVDVWIFAQLMESLIAPVDVTFSGSSGKLLPPFSPQRGTSSTGSWVEKNRRPTNVRQVWKHVLCAKYSLIKFK